MRWYISALLSGLMAGLAIQRHCWIVATVGLVALAASLRYGNPAAVAARRRRGCWRP